MARVIATGAAPPDPNQALLNQGVGGLAGGFGARLGARFAKRRNERNLAEDLNPFVAAAAQAGEQGMTQQQAMIQAAMSDPALLAQLSTNPGIQNAVEFAGTLGDAPNEAFSNSRFIGGESELGRELGIQPGRRARVKFSYDASGNLIGRPSPVANSFDTSDDTDDEPFGAGDKGRSLGYISDFAPAFAEGKTTPEQERLFLTSVSNLTQKEQFTDPDTGLVRTRRPELPGFARRALTQRGFLLDDNAGLIPPVQTPPDPADIAAVQSVNQASPTLSPDSVVTERPSEIPTLYEMALQGDLNGPIAAAQRFATRFGLQAQAEMTALTAAQTLKERVVKALQQSPRFAEGEAQRIGQQFKFEPEVIAGKGRYLQRAIAFDDALARIEQESLETMTGRRALVSGETRQHAMDTFNAIRNTRSWLIPPRSPSIAAAQEFIRMNTPGTPFLVPDGEGEWVLFAVPEGNSNATP